MELAKLAGFENISIDLMYGLPGQSLDLLKESVKIAMGLGVQHISIYGLQIEDGTPFAQALAAGKLDLPAEDETEAMYDYLTTALPANGFQRYEISNFAKLGYQSRHNLGYWQDKDYIGFGAAAHSYAGGKRLANIARIEDYIEAVTKGKGYSVAEDDAPRTKDIAIGEFAMLALRTAEGINLLPFQEKFGVTFHALFNDVVDLRKKQGLLEETNTHLRLTKLGMKYGNMVFADFL